MKNVLLCLSLLVSCFSLRALDISGQHSCNTTLALPEMQALPAGIASMQPEFFLSLTPSKFKEITGRKMKIKEVLALKSAQKAVKKSMYGAGGHHNSKNQLAALLFAIFLGVFGIHRFYLGYPLIGIIQLLTCGGCGIWWIIDAIMIATGILRPADGSNYDKEL